MYILCSSYITLCPSFSKLNFITKFGMYIIDNPNSFWTVIISKSISSNIASKYPINYLRLKASWL